MPEIITMPNTLEAFQAAVGGYIEAVGLDRGVCLLCHEEGKLIGLPANRQVGGDTIAGTFLIVGEVGGDFCSLSDEDAAYYAKQFAQPMPSYGGPDEPTQWEFIVLRGTAIRCRLSPNSGGKIRWHWWMDIAAPAWHCVGRAARCCPQENGKERKPHAVTRK